MRARLFIGDIGGDRRQAAVIGAIGHRAFRQGGQAILGDIERGDRRAGLEQRQRHLGAHAVRRAGNQADEPAQCLACYSHPPSPHNVPLLIVRLIG